MHDPYATVSLTVEQVQEALSKENLYFAALKLGRDPTTREALIHYIDSVCPIVPLRTYTVEELDEEQLMFI